MAGSFEHFTHTHSRLPLAELAAFMGVGAGAGGAATGAGGAAIGALATGVGALLLPNSEA